MGLEVWTCVPGRLERRFFEDRHDLGIDRELDADNSRPPRDLRLESYASFAAHRPSGQRCDEMVREFVVGHARTCCGDQGEERCSKERPAPGWPASALLRRAR